MTDMVLHCRLLAAALPDEEKRIRSSHMPTLLLLVAASTVVFVALGISKGATPRSMIEYGSIMIAYIACLAVWYPRTMRRRLTKCWETYDLEIGQDYLLRRQADTDDVRLQFDEVQAVERVPGRCLRVIGESKSRAISIPESIDHFDQVLETVSSLRPIRVRNVEPWQKYRAFMAVGLPVYIIMLWATSSILVIPLSMVMGAVAVWVFFWIRRNPNVSTNQKRGAWIYWLLFLVCLLKLLVAVDSTNHVDAPAMIGKVLAYMLAFSPCALLTVGWVRWWRVLPPRHWRSYAVAYGLATASISALCLYGVVSYIQLARIGQLNEHRLAMAGVYVGCPLSVFSVITAIAGDGRSRVVAGLAGGSLAAVWSVAFFYA
jgi:hypothetical protein